MNSAYGGGLAHAASTGGRATVLIVGASGQVGHHLAQATDRRGLAWTGTFHANPQRGLQQLDVRDAAAVRRTVRLTRPEYILAPAAATHVDRCERAAEATYRVNVIGTRNLADAANEVGATLVHFSSDYVFDGLAGPYDEYALPSPLSTYGFQKLIAEHVVMQCCREALIVRTTVVYGPELQGKNFIYRLLAALRRGEQVTVPKDQLGTPTYAPTLADAVLDLLACETRGVVNVAGREIVARDEFARHAARVFGEDPGLVRSVATADLGQIAARPLRAGLRTELTERRLGRDLLGYTEGLRRMAASSVASEHTASPLQVTPLSHARVSR
jgi:dTDP-4-dehydrorhamnose reductase